MRRAFAALSIFWLLVALVEPPGISVCPMHSSDVSRAPVATQPAGNDHAHHAAPVDQPATPDDHHGTDCRCLGDCIGSFGSVVVASTVALNESATVAADGTAPAHPAAFAPHPAPRLLPFATAPPFAG